MSYWFVSGLKDAYRARSLLAANILVVSGICLPILLLLGLKRGLIAQFRDDINKSPTARLITTVGAQADKQFSLENREAFRERVVSRSGEGIEPDSIALVIPDVSLPARIGFEGLTEVTLNSTLPGDPFLDFYGVDLIGQNERGLVLSLPVAEQIGIPFTRTDDGRIVVVQGIEVELQLTNRYGGFGRLTLPVLGIWEAPGSELQVARASLQLMDWIEDFKKGRSVPELGLEGAERPPTPFFDGYLSFSKVAIEEEDRKGLMRRGLTPVLLSESSLGEAKSIRSLYGLLRVDHELSVYWIRATKGESDRTNQVDLSADEVEGITYFDDVVVPWVHPGGARTTEKEFLIVPASIRARWLRSYFVKYDSFREVDLEGDYVGLQTGGEAKVTLNIGLGDGRVFTLPTRGIDALTDEDFTPGSMVGSPLFVSSTLASYLSQFGKEQVGFDPILNTFIPVISPNRYSRASVFVSDISEVPAVDSALKELNYITSSSRTRVEEMMGHARSLDMLILVIFAAVFLFGIFTLLSLFNDVTNRKRGTIGVMRLLGAGSRQIFIFLFVRSFLVAALAAGGSYAVGLGIAHLLERISVDCILTLSDLQIVAAGALVCCAIGVGLPAIWTIRRMEPVDAIANASVH